MDGSTSLSDAQWAMAVEAHARAFESPRLAQLVKREGPVAAAAVAFAGLPTDLVGWRLMKTEADLHAFADELRGHVIRGFHTGDGTGTGNAILRGLRLLEEMPDCERQIVDVATDGESNTGVAPEAARDRAEQAGVQVNAVVLRTQTNDQPVDWARDRVTTMGGFALEATSWEAWERAIQRKIVMELAALHPTTAAYMD
jgi:hypothetical protein